MLVSDIKLYEILKLKLGEKEAEALVEFVDSKLKENDELNSKVLATKEDIKQLEVKMAQMEARLTMRMFYFWLGQVAVIGGMLAYFFHVSK
jgi:hypothetical protein